MPLPFGTGFAGLCDDTDAEFMAKMKRQGLLLGLTLVGNWHVSQELLLAVVVPKEDMDSFLRQIPFVILPETPEFGALTRTEITDHFKVVSQAGYANMPSAMEEFLFGVAQNVFFIGTPTRIRSLRDTLQQMALHGNKVTTLPFVCVRFFGGTVLPKSIASQRISVTAICNWIGGTVRRLNVLIIFQALRSKGLSLTHLPGLNTSQNKALQYVQSWDESSQETLSLLTHKGLRLKVDEVLNLMEPVGVEWCVLREVLDQTSIVSAWNDKCAAAAASKHLSEIHVAQGVEFQNHRESLRGEQGKGLPYSSLLTPKSTVADSDPLLSMPGFAVTSNGHFTITIVDKSFRISTALFGPSFWSSVAAVHDPEAVDLLQQAVCQTPPPDLITEMKQLFPSATRSTILVDLYMEILLDLHCALTKNFQSQMESSSNKQLLQPVSSSMLLVENTMKTVRSMHSSMNRPQELSVSKSHHDEGADEPAEKYLKVGSESTEEAMGPGGLFLS